MLDKLQEIIDLIKAGQPLEDVLKFLSEVAINLVLASGSKSVGVGGSAPGAFFIPGDGNKIIVYNYYYWEKVKTPSDDPTESAGTDRLPCPYRGLFHFGPGDAEYFFGRESFVEELVKATQTRNFIPLLGASGSGKSSVVLAGLVPKLQQAGNWQFTHFRPGADPFYALAEALVPLYMSESDSTDKITQAGKLAESLKDGTPLVRIFSSIQRQHPNDRVLLIADQFEELYTLCTDETTRWKFLDILLAGIAAPADRIPCNPLLVATMRADFFGNALSYRPLADVLQNADLKLGPMNRTELTDAIEQPAQKLGVTFAEGLVKRILNDVEGEPGILPLLEFALTELWQRRSGKQLTHAAYEEIGKVQGALGRHADREYAKLSDADRERVQRILLQLVRPGEGAEEGAKYTRRIATKEELGEQNWSLVKQLADARLVVTSRNASSQETVEVVHEALIRNWGELRGWMANDREFRTWQERVRGAMRQWQEKKQNAGWLLRGAALMEAEEQWRQRREDLNAESGFIKQSLQSARWRKIKEIASYCLLGSMLPLSLWLVADTEYIMAKMQNQTTFFIPEPEFAEKDRRKDYYYHLLLLVLREAYPDKDKEIEIRTRKIDTNQGEKTDALEREQIAFKNLKSRIKIDITWMMQTNDRNELAKPIDYLPLSLGLLSHRLCLVNKASNEDIRMIRDKDLFVKKIHVTQVGSWPDSAILRSNKDIRLSETKDYEESKNQLLKNQSNCFLRGLNEIYTEQRLNNANFSIANNFFFQYYSPEYFYVAKENTELADNIKKGLIETLKTGKLLCLYKYYFGDFIKNAKLKKTNKIVIGHSVPKKDAKFYLDFTKEYTSIFKDIEKEQTAPLSPSDCNLLINGLIRGKK